MQKEKRFAWLIHTDDSCDDSLAMLPINHAVQLALERPCWTPEINHMWPARFKACSYTHLGGMLVTARKPPRRWLLPLASAAAGLGWVGYGAC